MHPKLKLKIYEAIAAAVDGASEMGLWDEYIHDNLYTQMTEAAALVFDSAQEAQTFKDRETA